MLAVGDGAASACVHMRVARAHICRCARARACWQAGPRVTTRAGPSSGLASETTPMTYAVKRLDGPPDGARAHGGNGMRYAASGGAHSVLHVLTEHG